MNLTQMQELNSEPHTYSITMTCVNKNTGEQITMTKDFDDSGRWNYISEMHFRFLTAMGYVLEPEEVGAEYR